MDFDDILRRGGESPKDFGVDPVDAPYPGFLEPDPRHM